MVKGRYWEAINYFMAQLDRFEGLEHVSFYLRSTKTQLLDYPETWEMEKELKRNLKDRFVYLKTISVGMINTVSSDHKAHHITQRRFNIRIR